ncbi:hypothetical protein DL771_009501 [Monosporascus sp. 5C6A]|nr:hypothetical protein DL771_009501 [Monosporascus sp. 5C6A]
MSSAQPPTSIERDAHNTTAVASSSSYKTPRVLSCVQCHQRKVKCNRKFPCANCRRVGTKCVPATLAPRRRRRKFPEHELLERVRNYEKLLRQSHIKFEPLRQDPDQARGSYHPESGSDSDADLPDVGESSGLKPTQPNGVHTPKDIWKAMRQEETVHESDSDSSCDGVSEAALNKAWDEIFANVKSDLLLFGLRQAKVDLTTLHPEPSQIFRLWQIYLDNVNPLLKATHTPSLQRSIVEATGNMSSIKPALEALMFSIYSIAISSLSIDSCQTIFGSREDLSIRYQFGCQQALANCGYLRTSDRDCLTALYLYLVSVRLSGDYRSLCSMLGVAIRIAQRMGINSEEACVQHGIFEAEMRRRLWWSLKHFDARIGELANTKSAALAPTWDCKVPLNLDDSDLRPEMEEHPSIRMYTRPTEAIFAVVRSEVGDFIRHSTSHLDFTNPALKPVAKAFQRLQRLQRDPDRSKLDALENMLQERYLQFCDPGNPLHFMTIWTTRGYLAKCRLHEHYAKYSESCEHQTEAEREVALSYALGMLECDTKLMSSPLTKGYTWLLHFHFPFPAYLHIVRDLRKRPVGKLAEQAWQVMSDNGEARLGIHFNSDGPLSRLFRKMVLRAWEIREIALRKCGEPFTLPQIVSSALEKLDGKDNTDWYNIKLPNNTLSMGGPPIPVSMPMAVDNSSLLLGMGEQANCTSTGPGGYGSVPTQADLDFDVDFDAHQLDWAAISWSGGGWPSF